jgi:hypothetical protein
MNVFNRNLNVHKQGLLGAARMPGGRGFKREIAIKPCGQKGLSERTLTSAYARHMLSKVWSENIQ